MREREQLLYIEDAKNRKLFYRFTPAAFMSNFAPLIVIFHDKDEAEKAPHFEYKMWNVLTPIDNFDYKRNGTVWLGEAEDFFVRDLLQELIKKIAQEHECEDHIYLYGKGMGGSGAILHAILCQADAVYAESASKEDELSYLLNSKDYFPIFYLCYRSKLEKERASFIKACEKYDLKFRVDLCSTSADNETQVIKEVLNGFERVSSQI